ncbi:Neuromedin-K receptor [Lamellibrachia satsuma]|nr:Neuromedin-K receptor [Lamellibrachia satsuma]
MPVLNSTQKGFIAATSVWLLMAFVANVCIIVVIVRIKKMRTVTNMFLGNLAVTDLILISFAIPMQLHDITHPKNYYESSTECRVVMSLPLVCITCSIYTMVALAEERYRAIVCQPPRLLTKRVAKATIIMVWCAALIVGLPTFLEYEIRTMHQGNNSFKLCLDVMPHESSLTQGIILLCVSYIIPQVFLARRYKQLVGFLWWRGGSVNDTLSQNGTVAPTTIISKHRRRSVKLLISVAVLFSFAWLPYFAMKTTQITLDQTDSLGFGNSIHMATITVAVFSTSYNFVVYMKYSVTFRNEFLRLLRYRRTGITPIDVIQ